MSKKSTSSEIGHGRSETDNSSKSALRRLKKANSLEKREDPNPVVYSEADTVRLHLSDKVASSASEANLRLQEANGLDSPPKMSIASKDFGPEIQKKLQAQGLDNFSSVLADNTGKKAESLSLIVLENQGIPDGNGELRALDNVIPGQHNRQGHGIDLIGVVDGQPVPIEVKKRAGKGDSMGKGGIRETTMEPETLDLVTSVLHERQHNPAMINEIRQRLARGEPDPALSRKQMAELWTRDSWIKLVKNDTRRAELEQAGIKSEYLDLNNLKAADSPQWRALLNERKTVIVSSGKEGVSNTLMREAVFKRGFDVIVINLEV